MSLDPTFKQEWIQHLRSGYYTQTSGTLHNINGYCCLGVACEVMGLKWEKCSYVFCIQGELEYQFIPNSKSYYLGLHQEIQSDLANMNDAGKTFDEIADWIEENL